MFADKEGRLEPLYSIECLSFMAHTDRMSVTTASIQVVSMTLHGGSVSAGAKGVVAMNMTSNTNIIQPRINRVQAVIVARALNICGISPSFWFYTTTFRQYYNTDCQFYLPFRFYQPHPLNPPPLIREGEEY